MWAVFKREFKAYFLTPIGFIYMGFFLLLTGIFFSAGNIMSGSSHYTGFLWSVLFIFVFAVPVLTMRLFAEEKKQRTDQLILTSPISIPEIVIGKFLAAFALYAITVVITILYPIVIAIHGDLVWSETIGSYIGFLFLGAGYISIGVLISAGTENQLTAALVTFFILLIVQFLDSIAQMIPTDMRSGLISAGVLGLLIVFFIFLNTRNWVITLGSLIVCGLAIFGLWMFQKNMYSGFMQKFLGWFSLNQRYQPFTLGLLKLDALVYYTSFSALFLFLTVRVIEKRRWN